MRGGGILVLALCLFTALAFVGPSAAADHPAADHEAGDHHPASAPEGGDNPFSGPGPYILDLAVWTVVIFLVLLFVLGKYAWKPMLAGLQKREDSIRSALAEAHAAHEEAKRIQIELQKQLAAAHEQVRQILDEGRRDAEQLREAELAKTQAEIKVERDRLHREIEMETAQAIRKIWSQAAELATLASAKALGRAITEDGHRKLIDEALAEIKASDAGANGHA
jgi:F-type H+-transporting ATPase subunit b